jgi:O-methyltransferase involved in polyketide biosynthesis
MYLTRDATEATLRQVVAMAPGSVLAMTFMLPLDLVDDDEQQMQVDVEQKARNSGTPFVSHYSPDDMVETCLGAGFTAVRNVSPADLTELYFSRRTDGLRPPTAEQLVVAQV